MGKAKHKKHAVSANKSKDSGDTIGTKQSIPKSGEFVEELCIVQQQKKDSIQNNGTPKSVKHRTSEEEADSYFKEPSLKKKSLIILTSFLFATTLLHIACYTGVIKVLSNVTKKYITTTESQESYNDCLKSAKEAVRSENGINTYAKKYEEIPTFFNSLNDNKDDNPKRAIHVQASHLSHEDKISELVHDEVTASATRFATKKPAKTESKTNDKLEEVSKLAKKSSVKVLSGVEKDGKNASKQNEKRLKKILFWTGMFGAKDWQIGTGQKSFSRCFREQKCEAVTSREHAQNADAVVFHMRDIRESDIPTNHPESQKWVFALKESPWYSWVHKFQEIKHVFNWTMTYRLDSDIPWLYGKTIKKELSDNSVRSTDYAAGKTKLVAWFVSRCPRVSDREKYAKELQKYIPVDIFGRCGPLKCRGTVNCFEMVRKDYKFYLSFENSICTDYITEKLWFPMYYGNVIPVVLGGGDYEKYLPPNSFINVMDFASPYELARHLLKLDKDDNLYNSYFMWKEDYDVMPLTENIHGLCELCAKLHSPEASVASSYDNINIWWNRTTTCNIDIYSELKKKYGSSEVPRLKEEL